MDIVWAMLKSHVLIEWLNRGKTIEVYFEPAAVITTLVLLGQVLELKARSRTNKAIRQLIALAPDTATVIHSNGMEQKIPLSDVHVGDIGIY